MLHAAEPAFQTEVISPVPLLRLAPNDAPAPIAKLSIAKRTALLACINAGGLCRKAGAWHGPCVLTRTMGSLPIVVRDGLQGLGWIEGRNLRLDVRRGSGDPDLNRAYAAELVSLKPDVIVTAGLPVTRAVQQQTQTIPIVFTGVGDPVAAGIVKSLTHPEGNATGITNGFSSIGGKWEQLLKEAVPRIEVCG